MRRDQQCHEYAAFGHLHRLAGLDQTQESTGVLAWLYVLVEAGPEQALSWRTGHMRMQYGVLPDLFFPADRSWLVSALWDDTWTCIGGPAAVIETLQHDRLVQARPARLDEDATPPGHDLY